MWTNIDSLQRIAKYTPYIFIVLGFLVAVSGQFARTKIDDRVKALKEKADIDRKLTPPDFDADIALNLDTNKYVVWVRSRNSIPFKASWWASNTKNEIISGVMLGDAEFFPDDSRLEFSYNLNIQEEKIQENYLELDLRWSSLYYSEMGNRDILKGRLVKKYRLIDRVPHPL